MDTTTANIAIIGMACRFPDASNYEEYWKNLQQARSCIKEVSPERWDWKKYWGDPASGKSIKNGAVSSTTQIALMQPSSIIQERRRN